MAQATRITQHLVLAQPSGASAPHITVSSGATATIRASIVPYNEPTYASSGLIKDGGGTLVLSGMNSFIGATRVNAATLRISESGSLAQRAAVTVAAEATLSNAGTINGSVTVGSGGIFISDAGTVAGAVTVSGTLYGTGRVGDLTLNAGGLLSAGALGGVGTFATGSLRFDGGTYSFDFDSGGYSDRLIVDGEVTLGTSAISLLLNSSTFDGLADGQWTLLDSTADLSSLDLSRFTMLNGA
jgi:autotransporter-associated beta strand protein